MKQKRESFFPTFMTALGLSIAIGTVWVMLVGWCNGFYEQIVAKEREYENLVIRIDGVPIIQRYHSGSINAPTFYTLDGEKIEAERTIYNQRPAQIMGLGAAELLTPLKEDDPLPTEWSKRLIPFHDGKGIATYWYFIHDGRREGSAYFAGFDAKSKMPVKYVGKNGFIDTKPKPSEQFSIDGRAIARNMFGALSIRYSNAYEPHWSNEGSFVYMVADGKVLEVDFGTRMMRTILEDEEIYAVGLARQALDELPDDVSTMFQRFVVARSADHVHLYNLQTAEKRVAKLPEELKGSKRVSFYILSDSIVGHIYTFQNQLPKTQNDLYWFDNDGKIVKHISKDVLSTGYQIDSMYQACLMCVMGPAPLVSTLGAFIGQPLALQYQGIEKDYPSALTRSLKSWWPALLATYLLGGFLARKTYQHRQVNGLSRPLAWAIFVFIGGVPTWLGYLYHRRWPPRTACESCEEITPRDRESCLSCGEAFPEPEPKGIELFA